LFGGYNNGKALDTILQYDITDRQTWVVLDCKLNKAIYYHGSITISPTEILIFGGHDGDDW